ncbi:hypothetical protein BH10CYA1_BH10CYA1_53090 [soil metagenome]
MKTKMTEFDCTDSDLDKLGAEYMRLEQHELHFLSAEMGQLSFTQRKARYYKWWQFVQRASLSPERKTFLKTGACAASRGILVE